MKVLLVGISTRFMAQSAAAAGCQVNSLDFFGDRDQPTHAGVFALGKHLQRPLTLKALAHAAAELAEDADAIMVVSGLENEPSFFELDNDQHRLFLNNSPESVRLVRDPAFLRSLTSESDILFPETILPGMVLPAEDGNWLLKDLRHSGGTGVSKWNGRSRLRRNCILQRQVEGKLCSLAFVGDGRRAVLLGMLEQYAGEAGLNAPPFAWCGNAAPFIDPELGACFSSFLQRLVAESGLHGLNGIDFMLHDGRPWLLEVNPRPGASIELLETLCGFNAFRVHLEACLEKRLPQPICPASGAVGKGILYSHCDLHIEDNPDWLDFNLGDIPHSGEVIPAGAPLCSIFACATDTESCWQNILQRARQMQECEERPFFRPVEG